MKKYILSFDQGTTSSRAILFDKKFNIVGIEQQETTQYFPKPGWVEQDANEIYRNQIATARQLINKCGISFSDVAAIGITNQRETTVVWNRNTGKPIYNAIIWQDKRTEDLCSKIKKKDFGKYINAVTGLVVDSYFSATKLKWILDNVPNAREMARRGDLLFGTIDTWLIWRLTSGKCHVTDCSNASRTMMFNIKTQEWDENILDEFDIPQNMLPNVVDSSCEIGITDKLVFDAEIPICGIAGDQQAALFGQACYDEGSVKNTYGTGCFLLMNTGSKEVRSECGLVTTIAWRIGGKVSYALEGSVFVAGAALKWLRDQMGLIKTAAETEKLASEVKDTNGVYFVPAFAGLGAPYWNMNVRGSISGITGGVTYKHIVRAALEAMAYQTKDVLDAMEKDSGIKITALNVDGGASVNNFLMQFQSDILQIDVQRPKVVESTSLGAAYLAALAIGWCSMKDLASSRELERTFTPKMKTKEAKEKYSGWCKAVADLERNCER
ncbi:MAG: glycerol kinase GlpK [Bacteroidales bacterium]|nr:glycerol kinase GlpK [Bacteroidales bacterium]